MKNKSGSCIRHFINIDAEQCCTIINACLPDMTGLNTAAKSYFEEKNIPPTLEYELAKCYSLVCERDGIIIGLGSLDGHEIKRMYIHPDAQKQGIGSRILCNLEQEARRKGIQTIFLQSSPSAVHFYIRFDYHILRTESITINCAVFCYILMEKNINK